MTFRFKSILMFFIFLGIIIPVFKTESATSEPYAAIVKIYVYYEDANNYISLSQTGSGVIIDPKGIILTNEHVITVHDLLDNEIPASYNICLTYDITKRPSCAFAADLIAKDKDLDLALLKIRPLKDEYAQEDYTSLYRLSNRTLAQGDSVSSMGYPDSGGGTITISNGTVLGVEKMNNLNWIKTNSIISFGSSGGALVGPSGDLLGITSLKNSDLGFAIDIKSINDWITDNYYKDGFHSEIYFRVNNFNLRQIDLASSSSFSNNLPHIEMTKPDKWIFGTENENYISTYDVNKNDGGYVSLTWDPIDTSAEKMLDIEAKSYELTGKCYSSGNIDFAGKSGKKLICPSNNQDNYKLILSSKNYFIFVDYNYGKDNMNKSEVDETLQKIKISDAGNTSYENHYYKNNNPYFEIQLPNDWTLQELNSKSLPVTGETAIVPELGFGIYVFNLTKEEGSMSNEGYLNYIKNDEYIKKQDEEFYSVNANRYFESSHCSINGELKDEVCYKYKFIDKNNDKQIKLFSAGYRVRTGDKVLLIKFSYLGSDQNKFEQYFEDFQSHVLVNFTLGHPSHPAGNTVSNAISKALTSKIEPKVIKNIGKKFIGRILLRVESGGEAWYLSPDKGKAYFLGRPDDAFKVMRELGLGISEASFKSYKGQAPASLAGKILLRVEANGEAYYVNPKDKKIYYLGRPADAFSVMRKLGLGISNKDFDIL